MYTLHKYYGDDPSSEKSLISYDTSSFLSFIAFAVFFSSASFFASALAYFEATSLLCCDSISNCAQIFFGATPRDLRVVVEEVGGSWLSCIS